MGAEPKKQDWRHWLAGGFAFMDAPFAVHPLDAKRARKMVYAAIREETSLDEIKEAAAAYLNEHSWNPDTILKQVDRVERFVKSIKPTKRKKSAWLITWEHVGDEAPDLIERLIAIRDGRTSAEKIKEFVEQYHISALYSLEEKMHYSSHANDNPYPAEYGTHPSGGRWLAMITCGHNPFIFARYVKNLRLFEDKDGYVALAWDDLTVPDKKLGED